MTDLPDFLFGSVDIETVQASQWGPAEYDTLLWNMAGYMIEGEEREAARLLLACSLSADEEYGDWNTTILKLTLWGPRRVYEALRNQSIGAGDAPLRQALEGSAQAAAPPRFDDVVLTGRVQFRPVPATGVREELAAFLDGKHIHNQARGLHIAVEWEGLKFRSKSELRIAQALDRARVMYLPNCRGRIGGKDGRRTIERDFLVILNGRCGILEVDGEPYHPAARSAIEHERDRLFKTHGVTLVERYDAKRCYRDPDHVVAEFLELMKRQAA